MKTMPENGTTTLKRENLADEVANRVRGDIIRGQISPGERILISDLVELYGVSHIPIREALSRLESEGWIVSTSNRHTRAAPVDLGELASLYDARRLLESELGRIAVARRTDDDVEVARAALAELAAALDRDPDQDFWPQHEAFHLAIVGPATSLWTERLLRQLWTASERYVRLFAGRIGSDARAMWDHEFLFEAFAAGEADVLAANISDHLSRAETVMREGYTRLATTFEVDDANSVNEEGSEE
jgi:DNA-binding GntR family transcriptional regulator